MKDFSTSSTRQSRHSQLYPKKRPSPHGITKAHKSPALLAAVRISPRSARSALIQQRQKDLTVAAIRKQGLLLEEEYHTEIRVYMHHMENNTVPCMTSMDQQPEIKWHMRPCLVDFLVEIHFSFRLRPETLYLALNIIDRYVSRRVVYIKHYQLVGCAALWIAAKFEDAKDRVPTVQELVQMCHDTYEESAFLQMESHILDTIQWTLGHPTAEAWLRLMCCGPYQEEARVQHIARFLMELTLFYREFIEYPSSTIAFASLTLARYVCNKARRVWEESEECLRVVEKLNERLAGSVNELSETVVKKYSYAFYSKAATFVVQYYLQGGRFERRPLVTTFPVTPLRSSSSNVSTPASSTTSLSDMSDECPLTPPTPSPLTLSGSDCLMEDLSSENDKENMPRTFEPAVNRSKTESIPDHFLPHDFVSYSRPALHSLNMSPRVIVS